MALADTLNKTLEFFGLGEFEENETSPTHNNTNEIIILTPKTFSEVKIISQNFRNNIPVIINLHNIQTNEARRLIDFTSGLAEGLGGKIERISNKTFVISPEHIYMNESEVI